MNRITFFILMISLTVLAGCCQTEKHTLVNRYQYFDVGIDDIPPVEKIEAILITGHYHPELFYWQKESGEGFYYVIGDPETVEEIIGHRVSSRRVMNDRTWIRRITNDFKNAPRTNNYSRGRVSDARAVFITKEKAFMVLIDNCGKDLIAGPDYASAQLKKDFKELGLE